MNQISLRRFTPQDLILPPLTQKREEQDILDVQIRAFVQSGGTIQYIEPGATGFVPKGMSDSNKQRAAQANLTKRQRAVKT